MQRTFIPVVVGVAYPARPVEGARSMTVEGAAVEGAVQEITLELRVLEHSERLQRVLRVLRVLELRGEMVTLELRVLELRVLLQGTSLEIHASLELRVLLQTCWLHRLELLMLVGSAVLRRMGDHGCQGSPGLRRGGHGAHSGGVVVVGGDVVDGDVVRVVLGAPCLCGVYGDLEGWMDGTGPEKEIWMGGWMDGRATTSR